MNILVVIPARGGSKGIPKKNIRMMKGRPLIYYVINTVKSSRYKPDIVVSTDSEEIAAVSRRYGAEIVMRDEALSLDMVTLDPVIFDAALKVDKAFSRQYDTVITIQPTSPLLSSKTLDDAISYFYEGNYDTVISVVNRPHLSWGRQGENLIPLYEKRLNRQELPPQYFETGAFVISKKEIMTSSTRIGSNVSVYEVPEAEAIDIDAKNDWILAESILARKRIVLRCDGYNELGMGHIYNCITMAYSLIEHDVVLVLTRKSDIGIKKVKETNLRYLVIDNDNDIDEVLETYNPDIWVNDTLNTSKEYIEYLKSKVDRVITIEDVGTGAGAADAVINALYCDNNIGDNAYVGWKYVCLRDEFQLEPRKAFSSKVETVLVMFGGTDPSNFNKLIYEVLLQIADKYKNIRFNFVTGIGYDCLANGVIDYPEKRIQVFSNVQRVTEFMKTADLAITSQGRTIFELAAMGVPSIVVSQNYREVTHNFAKMENGFLNLGVKEDVNIELIQNTLDWLINTCSIRRNMYDLMAKYELREGVQRVKKIIVGE